MPNPLLPQHAALITASAISAEVTEARGYRSATTKAELETLGFSRKQARVPALLLPVWTVDGEIGGYQIRPDDPRIDRDGKAVKYELPGGASMILDVPPPIREQLADPVVPLFVTEGSRKADSAVSAGLVCVALLGVDCWRGTNPLGGKTALAAWERIACNGGRPIYLTFDSDLQQQRRVYQALVRLKAFLESRGADVRVIYLPPGPDGRKTGLDDYLAAGNTAADLLALASTELRKPPGEETSEIPYRETPGGLVWVRGTRDGATETALTNFTARIVGDVLRDDGVDATRVFKMQASQNDRVIPFTLPAAQFMAMNWPTERLGSSALVTPGGLHREHARAAIQILSGDLPERRVYTHTGWRQVDGEWVYLHGGGAIGPDGPVDGVEVDLPGELARYRLPDPPGGAQARDAVKRSLGFLEIATREQTWPLLAAVYAAPLSELLFMDVVVWLFGPTGARKSVTAALALSHYGQFDRTSLPANFTSTGNALEMIGFAAKDAVLVVDDYAPAADAKSAVLQDAAAHRLIRAVGDRHGRNRLTSDARLRGERAPRCLPLVTAELPAPGGQSTAARTFEVEWRPGSVDLARLAQAQAVDAELYPAAMAGYLAWVSGQIDALRESLPRRLHTERRRFENASLTHGRIAESTAKLFLGAGAFLGYARDVGALTGQEAESLLHEGQEALLANALRTCRYQLERRPVALFAEYLAALFTSGAVYVMERETGFPPDPPQHWGLDADGKARSGGEKIGWLDRQDGLLYLLPVAVHRAVVRYAQAANVRFPVTQRALGEHLEREGFLARRGKDRREVSLRAEGRAGLAAWCIPADKVVSRADRDTPEPSPSTEPGSPAPVDGSVDGRRGDRLQDGAPDPAPQLNLLPAIDGVDGVDGSVLPQTTVLRERAHTPPAAGVCVRCDLKKPSSLSGPSTPSTPSTPSPEPLDLPSDSPLHSVDGSPADRLQPSTEPSTDPATDPVPQQDLLAGLAGSTPPQATILHERARIRPQVITDPAHLPAVAAALARAERIAVDTETTGLNPRRARTRLLSLATGEGVWVVDCFRANPAPILPALAAKPLILHHALFDFGFLAALGFDPGPADDTMLLSQLLHAGERAKHNLAAVAKRELDEALPKDLQTSDWAGALTREQIEYAARDAAILLPLREKLSERLAEAGLSRAAEIERRCLPAVFWMARTGVPFDAPAWEVLAEEAERQADRLRQELDAAAPPPPGLALGQGWNWESPQIVLRVFREAGVDLPNTNDETLAACPHPLAAILRQYREARKRAGTYGLSLLERVEDARIYPSWRQIGAESGRMACREPNVQNIPRDPAYRACVRAPLGRTLVKADYSQIELRIAAQLTGDRRMLAAYADGADLHTETARAVLRRDAVSKEDRQLAKALNFGLLYGMGSETLAVYAATGYGVALTPDEATEYRDAFFRAYPGVRAWHRRVRDAKASETRTLAGRRRLFNNSEPDTYRMNTPVQGTGADGLKRALALLWERRADQPDASPVLACHDEIVVECPAEQAEDAAVWLQAAMTDGLAFLLAPVPVEVETATGATWAG